MIGFPRALLTGLVLGPQAAVADVERRAYLDPADLPIDVAPQALAILDVTTDPLSFEIGAAFEVRHRIDVAVSVSHGDLSEAQRLRNAIVFDLCTRADAVAPLMMSADDPDTTQAITRVRWAIDWRPLSAGDDTVSEAVIGFTIDADVHTPVVEAPSGNRLLVGHGAPSEVTPWIAGDLYLDLDTGDVYSYGG